MLTVSRWLVGSYSISLPRFPTNETHWPVFQLGMCSSARKREPELKWVDVFGLFW